MAVALRHPDCTTRPQAGFRFAQLAAAWIHPASHPQGGSPERNHRGAHHPFRDVFNTGRNVGDPGGSFGTSRHPRRIRQRPVQRTGQFRTIAHPALCGFSGCCVGSPRTAGGRTGWRFESAHLPVERPPRDHRPQDQHVPSERLLDVLAGRRLRSDQRQHRIGLLPFQGSGGKDLAVRCAGQPQWITAGCQPHSAQPGR